MLNAYRKVLKSNALICLFLLTLAGCKTTETVYVDKVVEVNKPSIPLKECDIPKRDGDKVVDYIVSESRLYNALIICNLQIKAHNNVQTNPQI